MHCKHKKLKAESWQLAAAGRQIKNDIRPLDKKGGEGETPDIEGFFPTLVRAKANLPYFIFLLGGKMGGKQPYFAGQPYPRSKGLKIKAYQIPKYSNLLLLPPSSPYLFSWMLP